MRARRFDHGHVPVYRVVRQEWSDPLDASFSQRTPDRRWNTEDFPALYCCCSTRVARAVALDVFRVAGLEPEDLQPPARPRLAEIDWRGEVVDVVTEGGVAAAGFPAEYPRAMDRAATRSAGARWHAEDAEGVCARSASLERAGVSRWSGDHRHYAELAIFVQNAKASAVLRSRREDDRWLRTAS